MQNQYRSPTRKPVDTGRPINYSQPQRRPIDVNDVDALQQRTGTLIIEDDDDDYGQVGASAERSPGRISGRNRDTTMFDPMAKRATYLPYGGFDSIIDEYYTEGDPSSIAIPAPSELQRREQSRSPQRVFDTSASPPRGRPSIGDNGRPRQNSDFANRPILPRKFSGTSGHSSKAGSIHSSPPARQQITQAPAMPRQPPIQYSGKTDQYYDDDTYYTNDQVKHQAAPYPEEFPSVQTASHDYEPRAPIDRRMRPNDGEFYPERERSDAGSSGPSHLNGPPRVQREPPLRNQRSMDFPPQGRSVGRHDMQGRPIDEPRRRDQGPRDPRAVQQDPRLAPRSATSQDPRQMNPRQQMRPAYEQTSRPRGYDDRPFDDRNQGRPQRPVRDNRNVLNTAGAGDMHSLRPQQMDQPPLQRLRSPPGPRQQDSRLQPQDQRRPSPAVSRDERGPSPNNVRPAGQPPSRHAPPDGSQNQRPVQRAPQPNQSVQAPAPSTSDRGRSHNSAELAVHPDPVGVVTLAEIQSLRKEVAKTHAAPVQLTLVKRLMEAATVLASEGGKADAKQTKKNREDYSREALRSLKQLTAQEKPYTEAIFFLANCYGNGSLALEVDHERAFSLYEQAAKLQHPPSAYRTAVCLEIGAGTRPDPERAVRFYRRAAEYGDTAAMYKIGMILLRGLLEEKPDPRTAITWLQKAADRADIDNPHALHELALLYEKGDGAAGFPQDDAQAKDLFTRAAKLHYAPSQFRLGYAYEYGTLGCPIDPRRSIAWFSRGAERGDPESELSLSGWYLTGSDGVLAQNDREAYLWGRKAAEKGLAKAEFAVGYFFESGIGTNVDLEEAIKWYKRAATAGQKKAQERLLALGKRKR
ncbi:protein of unknown function [Taphrina deformans PYCC 5710]|uniref:Chitin synthase activator n=1 Tax=Taphrina deformans (strain PYCC 5710 / ATCC 11124 / CBS 356.35 / IMI 108563 / JCM 9778 / NBRC 8474) TaxID=1097556 RepID=R4XM03_TAPDE|nr:protein of unknown function [Taphrina deformans PYCC 5710]|eukprot:CCG84325.1 protein of unknown function [Taphrina deformans PYCC 5710]